MTDTDETPRVVRNDEEGRYELWLGDRLAGFMVFYDDSEGHLVLQHTEVDASFGGRGYASLLTETALEDIVARDETIVPVCPFVVRYLRSHQVPGLKIAAPTGLRIA